MPDKVESPEVAQAGVKEKQMSMEEELVPEDKQNENMLTITPEEHDEQETSFEEMKINLDLDEDAALDSSQAPSNESSKDNDISNVCLGKTEKVNATSEEKGSDNEDATLENKQQGKHVWISNIGRNFTAKQLRKSFGRFGTVHTAKILTNGQLFYGYIFMGTAEEATNCIKEMNNSVCEGYVLHVSRNRPELRKFIGKTKSQDTKKKTEKTVAKKTEEDTSQSKGADKTQKVAGTVKGKNENDKNLILELEKKLRRAHADISRFKRRLDDCERKKNALEMSARKETDQNRSERRRLIREKENFEKMKKDFEKRMSNDKLSVMKELDEVKALRVKLQNRLDSFLNVKSRSPLSRGHRNPSASISDERRYRDRERNTISRKRSKMEIASTSSITPPSPPVLSHFDRRGSQHTEQFRSKRAYYSDGRKHVNAEKSFSYLSRVSSIPPQDNGSSFPAVYRSENPKYPDVPVQPFVRYGNAIQNQNVQPILGPPRASHNQYMPDYNKPYGHY